MRHRYNGDDHGRQFRLLGYDARSNRCVSLHANRRGDIGWEVAVSMTVAATLYTDRSKNRKRNENRRTLPVSGIVRRSCPKRWFTTTTLAFSSTHLPKIRACRSSSSLDRFHF